MFSFESVQSRLLFWVAGTTGVLFAAAIVYSFYTSRAIVLDDASKLALATAESQANQIEEILRSVEEGTRLLGSTLEQTTISPDELEGVIRGFVEGNPRVFGSAAALGLLAVVGLAQQHEARDDAEGGDQPGGVPALSMVVIVMRSVHAKPFSSLRDF